VHLRLWYTKESQVILLPILRKIILFFAPLVIFYILRKIGKKNLKKESRSFDIDRTKIVEGKVIEGKK
jgi:hypothetical protein